MYSLDDNLSELIGIIIGDGCIFIRNHHYFVEIVGNPKEEEEYYRGFIRPLIKKTINKNSTIAIRERGIRLKVYSKEFLIFLKEELNLPHGKGKCHKVRIPSQIMNNSNLVKVCIRGIMDTDGSFFIMRKGRDYNYPSLEITTTSKGLAKQIVQILKKDFRISLRIERRGKFLPSYRIGMYGHKMLEKWSKNIGFSNEKNKVKYRRYTETFKRH